MQNSILRPHLCGLFFGLLCLASAAVAQDSDLSPTSLNSEIEVVPTPGAVTVDGKTDDWDLSAGIWSYNDPTLAEKNSVWTHLMWDSKGVYFLARYYDRTPLKNATQGKDFAKSWQADAYQARVILDDHKPDEHKPDEHELHINLLYSSSENQPYKAIVR